MLTGPEAGCKRALALLDRTRHSGAMTIERITAAQARRIALGAQGFGVARPEAPGAGHLRKVLDRVAIHQMDSVNVLVRAHYLPLFSRLGGYDRALLESAAWGPKRERRMFEYWAHEASLLPMDLHPLLRWKMARADRGEMGWTNMKVFATERRAEAEAVLRRIRDEGPKAVSDFEEGRSRAGWWEWGDAKRILEWLFYAGHITTATRRGGFERVYDLTERVIPRRILDLPTPSEHEAHKGLIERSARALGVATRGELRDYFRIRPADSDPAVAALVEEGVLIPVEVAGWGKPAYLHRDARRPRRIEGRALLAPFDPLIWERTRTERIFGFRYRLEIYTPAEKRVHGYYVLPFLLGDQLVARVDLKSDRQNGRLLVQSLHLEPDAPGEARVELEAELHAMAGWLGLTR